ncbi:MAG: hypothetical protein GX629_02500 [Phycisphaerae bacterium]|nr:hypothetical protein [Phycisphaerae bacterium]
MAQKRKEKFISGDMVKLLWVLGVFGVLFGTLWQINNTAASVILYELPWLGGILLAGLTLGWLPVRFLGNELPLSQKMITALACGLPMLSLLTMGLGLAELLGYRYLGLGLIGTLAVIGLIVLHRTIRNLPPKEKLLFEAGKYWPMLLMIMVPFLIILLLCAAIPPGVLWPAEGFGYDILEYHLQAPKEWFDAGRIYFLEHNVYANFPFNAEMLYLLAMVLKNDPHEAVYLAQMIHVSFTILFVAAIWVFTRPAGLKQATFSTLAAGTCGWLVYLGPLAYVEMGMLFTGVVALGLIWQIGRQHERCASPIRIAILAGLLLGLCAGFKYTALPMIALPVILMAMIIFIRRTKFIKAILTTAVMGVVCIGALSPYLVRNFLWTGNPVFPLAYDLFGGRGWNDELAERWKRGHSPREDEKPIRARLEKLYWAGLQNPLVNAFIAEHYKAQGDFTRASEIAAPPPIRDLPTFGFALLLLPWLIFFTRRQSMNDWLMLMIFVLQTLVWLFATHLQARFLIPWLIVLPFLVGRSADAFGWGKFHPGILLITGVMLLAAGLNFHETYRRYYSQTHFRNQPILWFGRHIDFIKGNIPGMQYLGIVNENPTARTLLIGEARPFYIRGPVIYNTVFNRDPLAEAMKKKLPEAKNYIAEIKPDFIYVDWLEILRLSRTYGFPESIKPNLLRSLSSYGRYTVQREEHWGPMMEMYEQKTPAQILYRVTRSEK